MSSSDQGSVSSSTRRSTPPSRGSPSGRFSTLRSRLPSDARCCAYSRTAPMDRGARALRFAGGPRLAPHPCVSRSRRNARRGSRSVGTDSDHLSRGVDDLAVHSVPGLVHRQTHQAPPAARREGAGRSLSGAVRPARGRDLDPSSRRRSRDGAAPRRAAVIAELPKSRPEPDRATIRRAKPAPHADGAPPLERFDRMPGVPFCARRSPAPSVRRRSSDHRAIATARAAEAGRRRGLATAAKLREWRPPRTYWTKASSCLGSSGQAWRES
jgi:hypothetical protein